MLSQKGKKQTKACVYVFVCVVGGGGGGGGDLGYKEKERLRGAWNTVIFNRHNDIMMRSFPIDTIRCNPPPHLPFMAHLALASINLYHGGWNR